MAHIVGHVLRRIANLRHAAFAAATKVDDDGAKIARVVLCQIEPLSAVTAVAVHQHQRLAFAVLFVIELEAIRIVERHRLPPSMPGVVVAAPVGR
jgi:hypothetical protein